MLIDDLYRNKPLHIQNMISKLIHIIRSSESSLQEHLYGADKIKILRFFLQDKTHTLFWIQASDKYISLYLHEIDEVDLGWLPLEGNYHSPYIKFCSPGDIQEEKLLPLLKSIVFAFKQKLAPREVKEIKKIEKPITKKITIENPSILMRKKKQFA